MTANVATTAVTALPVKDGGDDVSAADFGATLVTSVPEVSADAALVKYDVNDLIKATDNTATLLSATRKEISSRSLFNDLPSASRDIPQLLTGTSTLGTRLRAQKFNDNRTLILYDSQKPGKGYDVLQCSELAEEFFTAGMGLANERYATFIDIATSREFGTVKIAQPGMVGLNIKDLDALTNAAVLDVDTLARAMAVTTDVRSYRVGVPAIMTDWEAHTYDRVRGYTLENNLVIDCQERMESMRRMLAYDPRVQQLAPENLTGEYPLAMATGYSSQLWEFPNANPLLTHTALNFLPLFSLTMRSASSDLVMLGANNQRNDIGNVFSAITPSDPNQLDIMRIIAAMIFPQQIQIQIDTSDASSSLDMLGAILSKLFLSTSENYSSVAVGTARTLDGIIGSFLTQNRYISAQNAVLPLDLTHRANVASLWSELSTNDNVPGSGWINHRVRAPSVVPNHDHDYARRVSVPQYGDILRTPHYGDGGQEVVRSTPLLHTIIRAAGEINTSNMNALSSILNMRKEAYIGFLSMLNEYIYKYTYNSFRAPDNILVDLGLQSPERMNDPVIISLKPRAFVALWKFLPSGFEAPIDLLSLPEIESKIETEISLYKVVHSHVSTWVDNQNLNDVIKGKQIAQIASKVSGSKVVSAMVIAASGDPYNERLYRVAALDPTELESPFARHVNDIMGEITVEPELIGYTYAYAWKADVRKTYTGTIDDLRDGSQIVDNVQDWNILRRIDLNRVVSTANSGRFISEILVPNNRDDGQALIGLQIPIPVEVVVTDDYDRSSSGTSNVLDVSVRKTVSIDPSESVRVGVLTDRYVVPSLAMSQFPDAHILVYPAQNDWYIGARRAFSMTVNTIYRYQQALVAYSGIRVRKAITTLFKPRDLDDPVKFSS